MHADRLRKTPYGMDAVFHSGATLFNAWVVPKVNQFYNTSFGSGQTNDLGRPYPFQQRHECVGLPADTYSLLIDDGITGQVRHFPLP